MAEKSKSSMDMSQAYRVLDANLNRASEGLRTLDDYVRFIENNQELAIQMKRLRHDLADAMKPIDRRLLLEHRDTLQDVGTSVVTESEMERKDWRSIVTAAAQRTQQAVRSMEEFSKLISAETASALEVVRYRLYTTCGAIEKLSISRDYESEREKYLLPIDWLVRARLYVLVDCQDTIDCFEEKIAMLAKSGVDLVQIRDKNASTRTLLDFTRKAIRAAGNGMKIIVNDRLDIALASGAAGVHLGQDDLPIELARKQTPNGFCVGISTHSVEQAIEAEADGADYIGCGPTFPSCTKQFESFTGTEFLSKIRDQIAVPAFAIGGVNHSNVFQVLQSGITRIAVSSAVWNQANMQEMAIRLCAVLED